MSTAEILEVVKKIRQRFAAKWVCLTGGEPLLQNVGGLARELKTVGFNIQIETNATIYRPLAVDWYTVSPKPDKYFFQPEYRKKAAELKLVVTRGLNLDIIQNLRSKFPDEIPILLQPQSNRKWSANLGMKILRNALNAGLKNIRLSVQIHKIYGFR